MTLKNGKVFTSKFVGTEPSSYENRIYLAAVLQRLRNPDLEYFRVLGEPAAHICSSICRINISIMSYCLFCCFLNACVARHFTKRHWTAILYCLMFFYTEVSFQLRTVTSHSTPPPFFFSNFAFYCCVYRLIFCSITICFILSYSWHVQGNGFNPYPANVENKVRS